MDANQIMSAYRHIAALCNEHDNIEPAAESLGIEPALLYAVEAVIAGALDDTLQETHYWPPESEVQRMTGLGLAFGLGFLTALQAQREAVLPGGGIPLD